MLAFPTLLLLLGATHIISAADIYRYSRLQTRIDGEWEEAGQTSSIVDCSRRAFFNDSIAFEIRFDENLTMNCAYLRRIAAFAPNDDPTRVGHFLADSRVVDAQCSEDAETVADVLGGPDCEYGSQICDQLDELEALCATAKDANCIEFRTSSTPTETAEETTSALSTPTIGPETTTVTVKPEITMEDVPTTTQKPTTASTTSTVDPETTMVTVEAESIIETTTTEEPTAVEPETTTEVVPTTTPKPKTPCRSPRVLLPDKTHCCSQGYEFSIVFADCIAIFKLSPTPPDMTHATLNAPCTSTEGFPVTIANELQNTEIYARLKAIFTKDPSYHAAVVIGYQIPDGEPWTENGFRWVDGSSSTYTKWASGEPHSYWPNEVITAMDLSGMWLDLNITGIYEHYRLIACMQAAEIVNVF